MPIKAAQVAECGSGDYGGNIRKTPFGVIPTRLKHAMGYKTRGGAMGVIGADKKSLVCDIN